MVFPQNNCQMIHSRKLAYYKFYTNRDRVMEKGRNQAKDKEKNKEKDVVIIKSIDKNNIDTNVKIK